MTQSQASPRTKKGFQTFTANDIYSEHGILARDVQLIAEKFGVRLPCTAGQKAQIVEFAAVAKQQGQTVKQAIDSLQDAEAQSDAPSGFTSNPDNSWSQEPTLETEFSDTEEQLLAVAATQKLQNELAVAQMNGLLIEAQTQLAEAAGRKRMALMLQGLIDPTNDQEAALVANVRRATGVYQQKILPFIQVGEMNGQPQLIFKAIAPTGNSMAQAMKLLLTSNGTGIIPQPPLAQLMEQLQSGRMPTLQPERSLLPQLEASTTATEPEPQMIAEAAVEPSPELSPAHTDL